MILQIGETLAERTYVLTQEKINCYSRYALGGRDVKNIHTDPDKARLAGLSGPVVHGRHPIAFFSEVMFEALGERWLTTGHLEVTLTRLICPGDILCLRARVTALTPVGDDTRADFEMTLVNQRDEVVQSARATALLPTRGDS